MLRSLCFALCSFFAALNSFAEQPPLKIGALFSLSSWAAVGGVPELKGVQLAVDEINNAGGIQGRKIELIVEDNASDLKKTTSAFQKLASIDKVVAVVGPNWAEFTEVVAPLAKRLRVPTVSPSGHRDRIFVDNPYIFTFLAGQRAAVKPLTRYMVSQGFKRVAVILSQNSYYEEVLAAIQAELKGSEVILDPIIETGSDSQDFRSILLKLRSSPPSAMMSMLVENVQLATFFKQTQEMRIEIPHLNAGAGLPYDEAVRKTPGIAEGVIYYNFIPPSDSTFLQLYEARYKTPAPTWTDRSFDAVQTIAKALAVTGGQGGEALAKAIASSKFEGASGTVQFQANGVIASSEHLSELFQIKDGRFEKLTAK